MILDVEFSTWRARLWLRVARVAALFIGGARAYRWGERKAFDSVRFRIAGTKTWSRLA